MIDYAIEIERAILGACILEKNLAEDLLLPRDAFYVNEHRYIYDAIKNTGGDYLATEQYLKEQGVYDHTISILNDCLKEPSTNFEYHYEIVKEKYLSRKWKKGLMDAIKKEGDVYAMISDVQELADGVIMNKSSANANEIIEREKNRTIAEIIQLNDINMDLFYNSANKKGMLEVTIADSGHGKTQYAMYKAWKVLNSGYKVFWVQLEGFDVDTAEYFIKNDYSQNIYINHSIYDVEEIKNEARNIKREHGLDYIVIDYVQNVECSHVERSSAVEYISKQFTKMAKKLNCYVHLLSQVTINYNNRSGWKQEPSYGDVRWSQQLKQDAHVITSVFRPSRINSLVVDGSYIRDFQNNTQDINSVYVKQAKLRHGQQEPKRLHLIHTNDGLLQKHEMKNEAAF